MPMLIERLEEQRRHAESIAEIHDAYTATLAELRRTPFLEHALRVGEPFPDFLLPNADGRLVSRDDLLARGPMVATFFRGTWCPYCAVQLA
ncbi:MAG: redoxin domain-containing protein, partial [Acetobacteraceae bacterium]|nr:redoxin domain-containing protein [Acetobacteraceae bacterium]